MQKKLSKILVLSELLIDEIDDSVITPTKETRDIQYKAMDLQSLLLPVVDKFYQSKQVRRSTFFNIMNQKFNYIFNKEYNNAK